VASIPLPKASYEPKRDGFRSICFRDRDEVELGSRNERSMTSIFPELIAAIKAELPRTLRIDGRSSPPPTTD
jgi:ATP-dependent DNA ligase